MPLIGMGVEVVFGKIYRQFKKFTRMLGIYLITCGLILCVFANSYFLVMLVSTLIAMGYPMIVSAFFTLVLDLAPAGAQPLQLQYCYSELIWAHSYHRTPDNS